MLWTLLVALAWADPAADTIAEVPADPPTPAGWVSPFSADGRSWHRSRFAAPEPRQRLEVALGAGFGVGWFDTSAWQQAFADKGYDTLGPVGITPLSVNGELYANVHVPGFDYIGYEEAGGEEGTAEVGTTFRLTLTELSYGYLFYFGKGFGIAPRVGFGILDLQMATWQRQDRVGFGDTTNGLAGGRVVQKQAMITDLGVGITQGVPTSKRQKLGIHTAFRFTLRMGAMVQLFDTAPWNVEGVPVDGAPAMRVDGVYARLIVSPGIAARTGRVDVPPKKTKGDASR